VTFTGPDGVHHTLINHNKLVTRGLYQGANGFKTGFTSKAQNTLVATATRGGRTLIVVILGTYDAYGWATRFFDVGFSKKPGEDTGQMLPPTRVTTYAARALQFAAMRRLASGPLSTSAGATPTQAPPTTGPKVSAPAGTQAAGANPTALAATPAAATKKEAGGGGLSGKTIAILIVVLLLATAYVLRVRAVRRARARRLARRRATRSMMRRGGLPVVDGRYRTGTRVGKPVESHVQLRRDQEPDDATASGYSG
jgi:D-alanyl-D-alanine carboxypeptidase